MSIYSSYVKNKVQIREQVNSIHDSWDIVTCKRIVTPLNDAYKLEQNNLHVSLFKVS